MFDIIVDAIAVLLGMHALLKFAFFFVFPYSRRRAALDRAYAGKPTATRNADAVLLASALTIACLILWRGLEPTSFLGGFWIGATLIQLYFHRFDAPLQPSQAPPPAVSPIKMMSYAIQAAPQRPWRELLLMTALIAAALVLMGRRYL